MLLVFKSQTFLLVSIFSQQKFFIKFIYLNGKTTRFKKFDLIFRKL